MYSLNGNGHRAAGKGLGATGPLDVLTAITGAATSATTAIPQLQAQAEAGVAELRQALKLQLALSAITAVASVILVLVVLKKK